MNYLKNLLLYGGLTEDAYNKIVPAKSAENRKYEIGFSIIGIIFFMTMFFLEGRLSLTSASYEYLIVSIVAAAFALLVWLTKGVSAVSSIIQVM